MRIFYKKYINNQLTKKSPTLDEEALDHGK